MRGEERERGGREKGVEEEWNARRTEAEQSRAKLEQRAQGTGRVQEVLGGTAWVGLSARWLVGQEKKKKRGP